MRQRFLRSHGHALGFAVPMALLLLFSSMAYLRWQVYGQDTSRHQVAAIQAYYTAQAAVIQIPLAYMRNQRPSDLTNLSMMAFPDGSISDLGEYRRPLIELKSRQGESRSSSLMGRMRDYELSATGIVRYNDNNGNPTKEVSRKARLRITRQLMAHYFYLTEYEQTRFGEMIYFWNHDTLQGRVHTNSEFAFTGGLFTKLVTQTGSRVYGNSSAAIFRQGFRTNVPQVEFPVFAQSIRDAAAASGTWLNTSDCQYIYGLQFQGSSAMMWRWQAGTRSPFCDMTQAIGVIDWNTSGDYGIFCDGTLWIRGTITVRIGIGAAGSIRLMDNLVYSDCQQLPYVPLSSSNNMVTLVSEVAEPGSNHTEPWTGIVIANTPENGRENGGNLYPPSNQTRRDIAICAQIITLHSSFTFEDQNDTWDDNISPTRPDERGTIYLRGAIAQWRRGYVHRNNLGGTGYNKGYLYDERFETVPPPFIFDATNRGFVKWNVVAWSDDPLTTGE